MRSWPSDSRCPKAWSTATASSVETRGKSRSSIAALTSTTGQPALEEPVVVLVRGVRLGVVAAREDHAGDLLVDQHRDVVGLGQAARGARAQHRGEALLGERSADHLGERGEDRVAELGQDQADQPGALAAQLRRPLVAEDVQGGQHGGAGGVGDAGLAVEHPADGGLADPDLLGHLGEPARLRRFP